MKKRFFTLILILIFGFSITIQASAWAPADFFICGINKEKMPENTAYIDLLFPMPTNDKAYTVYNKSNGKKYGISEESEIVNYCADGYRSYTFHIKDAQSQLIPQTDFSFYVPKKIYYEHKDLFSEFEEYCFTNPEDFYKIDTFDYYMVIESNSKIPEKISKISKELQTDFHTEEDGFYTTYNTFDAEYDYGYCCKNYKYAKIAYLDTNGNILAVSNEVKIRFYSLRPVDVSLSLSGTNFTSIPNYGPPYYLIIVIPILHFIALIFVIILGIRRRTKKFTK